MVSPCTATLGPLVRVRLSRPGSPVPWLPAIGSAKRAVTRMSARSTVGVGEQRHPWSIDQRVATSPSEHQRAVGQLRGERRGHVPEALEVVRVEVDDEPVRDERAVGGRQSLGLHRALDAALELDGLQSGPEQASGWTFEEAFEEPLDGGERRHGRSQTSRGSPAALRARPDHPRARPEYPRRRGDKEPCAILSPRSTVDRPILVQRAHPGDRCRRS